MDGNSLAFHVTSRFVSVVSAPTPYPKPDDGLPGWAIAVIAVVCVLLVAVLTCAIAMFLRERAGKPIFQNLEDPKKESTAPPNDVKVSTQA